MVNGNNVYSNGLTAPTQTAENYGLFAFYAVDGVENAYYIYSKTAGKWLTYTKAASYNNGKDFVKFSATQVEDTYFKVNNYSGDYYEIQPYTTSGTNDKYINWYQGVSGNPYDGTNTLGLWQDSGNSDGGSRYLFVEVVTIERVYTINVPEDITIKVGNETFSNGETYTIEGSVKKSDITVVAPEGQFAAIVVDDEACTISVFFATLPQQATSAPYTNAVLYPAQQTAVGAAKIEEVDGVYTLSNNVLAASFMKLGNAIFFAGSDAMNLEAGTEIFSVAFGDGDNVNASAMTLKNVEMQDLEANADAIGGAEHFAGKQLVANYEYTYKDSTLNIVWRAVLRDGSHYLRTEMELAGVDNVDMYNVIPLMYNVDTKAAGSTPAVVGNTRGAVIMSNKIFAGLETPTAYNTVGDATGEEDKYNLTTSMDPVALTAASWVQVEEDDVPDRVVEAIGIDYPNIYAYKHANVTLQQNQKVEITVEYTSGSHRLNFAGADLLTANGAIAANDYHSGYSGTAKSNNTFTFIAPADGTYTLRVMVENKSESIDAESKMTVKIYTPKEGVVINTDIVGIQGRWSRNTTLETGETWKVAGVVGLVAQDGSQDNENIHKTQKRRSFLAYSERERAVPWRAFPCYISWYELNINRNNAAPGSEHTNFTSDDIVDVLNHWVTDYYNRYGEGPAAFVIDDGWDNYGTWTFHSGFPDEMRPMATLAEDMGAGVGAWLGPVGGYGQSGNYRRDYWSDKGGMQLSNPAYYSTFKAAAYNLVKNQGDYKFFKFDGISAQFTSVGPDAGDTGNENAEGIIRLERYVREELREDIFFNTTVGTWASPFWYQITDATWRQENDHDRIGDNTINRENWITYRDRLVYQNYVSNSPICPINTLMTHGFMLTQFGPPASDSRDYEAVLREMRCAFVCGSGLVELYNDYALMNSVNNGALWADLAECIAWQKRNADVLPDIHWVGGNPWDTGADVAAIYGWASWNGTKSTLALRNGSNDEKNYTFTLREALNIPANVNGSIILRKSFGVQAALEGLTEGEAVNIDTELTVTLPASSVYAFDGIDAAEAVTPVGSITLATENGATEVALNRTLVALATVNPTEAVFHAVEWTTSDASIATVNNGLIVPQSEGEVTITATATDGSGVSESIIITVGPAIVEPYATNFDKEANASRSDRYINSISFTEEGSEAQTITVGSGKPYRDMSEDEASLLTCAAGSTISVEFNKNANWMNAYVYIDLDNDQQFSFVDGSTDQSGTDVMSFSFYTGNFNDDQNGGVNSAGTSLTGNARNTAFLPTFTAPETPGDYRIRFKMDWNSIDAGGQIAADGTCTGANGILANGGVIVDATLRVVDNSSTGIEIVEAEDEKEAEIYDLSGRRLDKAPAKGIYIINNKKVVR
ncbi:MAG: Ig-like domain-containing protein [Bacteroidaceae bacterium]|nr:Ig-like domain-containing protein [Bacteroidaceae bacterium]